MGYNPWGRIQSDTTEQLHFTLGETTDDAGLNYDNKYRGRSLRGGYKYSTCVRVDST